MTIVEKIVAHRKDRVAREGYWLGARPRETRDLPVARFGADPFLVCEVKRRSPSKGDIAPEIDVVDQARAYAAAGVRSISVLTEEDNFSGSLDDLERIKRALPGVAVLRKDFLLDEEDIEVSWRAGADAVLLIASILDERTLVSLHRAARDRGLSALVEIHSASDVERCRSLAPELVGINCRDLATFHVDLAHPLVLRPLVDWTTRLVFESGIRGPEDVSFALSGGFDGVLVGETAMRSVGSVPGLLASFGSPAGDFWMRLYTRKKQGRPLVKVCGITRVQDAETAIALGADALGFVMAPSKRRASLELVRALADIDALKVAVVVTERNNGALRLDPDVRTALDEGLVNAVQFHGEEQPDECAALAFPYYKAVRVKGAADVESMGRYHCPRVLADAWSADAAGGTGKRIPEELAKAAGDRAPLWIAGGIGPENVGEVVRTLRPELIDASSKLEAGSGVKDADKLKVFFEEIQRNAETE
ncbi:MAG TPA: bifunctional indole-3-glycerol phosphate synthase/phosphoribosylanthranilate isomerase [Spirochaetia bacterium]|nr:bifunctional indole-3-glycerol phosphate synthase/phosphoribosylanthranilate isomerase [Spirochaetia bacterium]